METFRQLFFLFRHRLTVESPIKMASRLLEIVESKVKTWLLLMILLLVKVQKGIIMNWLCYELIAIYLFCLFDLYRLWFLVLLGLSLKTLICRLEVSFESILIVTREWVDTRPCHRLGFFFNYLRLWLICFQRFRFRHFLLLINVFLLKSHRLRIIGDKGLLF